MHIFLTFDYELFFGNPTGSVQKCMLEPTERLFKMSSGKNVKYTFFVDVGYLICAKRYESLDQERELVENQVKKMIKLGHDVQLHIHPHWERAKYVDGKWDINVDGCYKLSDFSKKERSEIIGKYKNTLEDLTGTDIESFRAGGWCIQPFSILEEDFKRVGLRIDSSVFTGGYLSTKNYNVDFTNAPKKSLYRFQKDVCMEQTTGEFIEIPISSMMYSPLFYWRLYLLGRIFPSQHKMLGDGLFISQGGQKKRVLSRYTHNHISSDGYFSKVLKKALSKAQKRGDQELVVIGHPKSQTRYSEKMLGCFIEKNHKIHNFTSFSSYAKENL